jgi:uncharacterized protein YpuA (DUF1002 family)
MLATMKFEIADTLNKMVSRKYQSAKSSGSLIFSPTELTVIHSKSGIPVSTSSLLSIILLELMSSPVSASVLPSAFEEGCSQQI